MEKLAQKKTYSAMARETRERGDTADAELNDKLADEDGEKAQAHAEKSQKMVNYERYWRAEKAAYLEHGKNKKKNKK